MKALPLMLLALSLAGCAGAPALRDDGSLFDDAEFKPPAQPVRTDDVFTVSPAMRAYFVDKLLPQARRAGARQALFEVLKDDLQLEYDSERTRTAAEAFDARAGNCLSLVILGAAFAREFNISVDFQSVRGFDTWSRSAGITFRSGHVNLVLEMPRPVKGSVIYGDAPLTIDFVPPSREVVLIARPESESTIVAMFLNNRAAEALVQGDIDQAYWYAREAIRTAPSFNTAYNTLGVIYLRHGNRFDAEAALRHVLEREPANPQTLANLANVLSAQGRGVEAAAVRKQLADIEPFPPFWFYDQGIDAMRRGNDEVALGLFRKELQRMPYDDEVHFAMALASLHLGEPQSARQHLALAAEYSTTHDRHELYAAKLEHLKLLQH